MDMEKLVEQAKTGDRQAQNTLYYRYRQRSYAVCRRITRDKELSEELVDDAFLIALNKLDCLHDPDKFGPWLSAISARLALRHLKRQPDSKPIPISHIEGFDIACDPHDAPFTHEELQSAIDRLPTGYRQVFTMSVIEGRQHKEIASILNIEPHSSSSQLCHARAMLRRMLGPLMCILLLSVPFFLMQDSDTTPVSATARVPEKQQACEPSSTPADGKPNDDINPVLAYNTNISCSTDTVYNNQIPIQLVDKTPSFSHSSTTHLQESYIPLMPDSTAETCQHWLNKVHNSGKWAVTVALAPSLADKASVQRPHPLILPSVASTTSSTGQDEGVAISNWHECKVYVLQNSKLFSPEVAEALIRIAQSNELDNNGQIIRNEHHEPPSTLALTLHYAIDSTLSLYSGISHNVYRSYFQTGVGMDRIDEHQSVNFLGIPMGISYCPHPKALFGCHFSADITLLLPLSFHSSTCFVVGGQIDSHTCQPSAYTEEIPLFNHTSSLHTLNLMAGLRAGLHYRLTPSVSLYAECGVSYTLPCWQTVAIYSSLHPLAFTTHTGLRFTF